MEEEVETKIIVTRSFEQNTACDHHPELVENQELKGKVIELRGKLMDKSVQLNHLEGTVQLASILGIRNEMYISSTFGRNKERC